MAALSNSLVVSRIPPINVPSGSSSRYVDRFVGHTQMAFNCKDAKKSISRRNTFSIQAAYSDGGRSSSASVFVGGFVLGGLIVGTLSCVYAPQISQALTGTDKKDLMKKLPRFIYDEEKALEKQRKKLAEKIEQLNSAIDNVSNQLRSEDSPNGAAVSAEDIEAVF